MVKVSEVSITTDSELRYPFETIIINQRELLLNDILSGKAQPVSDFETSTFSFIKMWMGETKKIQVSTSGSTGPPKQIVITRGQMQRSAQRTVQALNIKEGDTALVCLNTEFIAGKMMLVRALEANLKIIAVDPSSDPFRYIKSQHIDFMAVVPMQLKALVENEEYQEILNRTKAIIVGGVAISTNLLDKIQSIKCPVYATYGMTETISHIALQLLTTEYRSEYFQVLPGVQVSTKDDCLIIEDEILSEKLITNDLVEIHEPGKFRWLGRADNVINSGGIKINPELIEQKVERIAMQLNIEQNYFVGGLPHETLGQQAVLFFEGNPLSELLERQLMDSLIKSAPAYHVPKAIRYVPSFSYTETGKINRKKSIQHLT